MSQVVVILLLCGLTLANAYSHYQARIPNVGEGTSRIPIPSNLGIRVDGVPVTETGRFCQSIGHVANCGGPSSGGGNEFGRAFNDPTPFQGTFTLSVCTADSDGDGFTNGDELGDPFCQFVQNVTGPNRTTCLSHPGFNCSTPCDPFCEGNVTQPQCLGCTTGTTTVAMPTTAPTTTSTTPPESCPELANNTSLAAYTQCINRLNGEARRQYGFFAASNRQACVFGT